MTVNALRIQLQQAELIEQQQGLMPNDQYSSTLHYLAMAQASEIRWKLLNHPDLTTADFDELLRVKGDIPYQVSC